MKLLVSLSLVISILLLASFPVMGEEVGRYQAIKIRAGMGEQVTEVFITDSKEGHLWIWRAILKHPSVKGSPWSQLIYLGRVRPGEQMGEIIERKPPQVENK